MKIGDPTMRADFSTYNPKLQKETNVLWEKRLLQRNFDFASWTTKKSWNFLPAKCRMVLRERTNAMWTFPQERDCARPRVCVKYQYTNRIVRSHRLSSWRSARSHFSDCLKAWKRATQTKWRLGNRNMFSQRLFSNTFCSSCFPRKRTTKKKRQMSLKDSCEGLVIDTSSKLCL